MALLRPGRCCSRRQGGCLRHRAEAQRRPKGQNAGGTPALPGDKEQDAGGTPALPGSAAPGVRWGVSGGRLLGKPTCALWETPVCPRAGRPPCRADHSRKNSRSLMKTNHEWTRRDTKTGAPPSTTSGTKMLLQFGALGVTMSWDDGFPGARASRPHNAWHNLGHLPHLDQPGTAPWLYFGLAAGVPAHRVAACSRTEAQRRPKGQYAGGTPALPGDKEQDAGGTPALPGMPPPVGELTGSTSVARGRRRPFGCDAAAPGKGRRPLRAPVRPGRVLPGDRLSGRTA